MDEQRVKTRDFRQLLREFIEAVRFQRVAIIIQNNGKDVAVLMNYERYQELRKKAGEIKEEPKKEGVARRRVKRLDSLDPTACVVAIQ